MVSESVPCQLECGASASGSVASQKYRREIFRRSGSFEGEKIPRL